LRRAAEHPVRCPIPSHDPRVVVPTAAGVHSLAITN
jgi:hypothetical protein